MLLKFGAFVWIIRNLFESGLSKIYGILLLTHKILMNGHFQSKVNVFVILGLDNSVVSIEERPFVFLPALILVFPNVSDGFATLSLGLVHFCARDKISNYLFVFNIYVSHAFEIDKLYHRLDECKKFLLYLVLSFGNIGNIFNWVWQYGYILRSFSSPIFDLLIISPSIHLSLHIVVLVLQTMNPRADLIGDYAQFLIHWLSNNKQDDRVLFDV